CSTTLSLTPISTLFPYTTLFRSLTGLDLDDRVAGVIGIAGHEEVSEFGLDAHQLSGQALGLGGEVGIVLGQLHGRGMIGLELGEVPGGRGDLFEFRVPPRQLLGPSRISMDDWRSEERRVGKGSGPRGCAQRSQKSGTR